MKFDTVLRKKAGIVCKVCSLEVVTYPQFTFSSLVVPVDRLQYTGHQILNDQIFCGIFGPNPAGSWKLHIFI
jgi:hypothetical protein